MIRMLIVDDKKGSFQRIRNIFDMLHMDRKIQTKPDIEYVDDIDIATHNIKSGIYHVALIDLGLPISNLTASTDYDEFAGIKLIELAHEFNKDTVLVAYTSYATQNMLKLVKLKVDSILNKAEPDDKIESELLEIIELVQNRFNFSLDIKLENLLNKAFKKEDDLSKRNKWEICLQRIVSSAKFKINYKKLSQGYSGAGVVVAFLDSQLPRVFKLHTYVELKREIDNFEKYVRYFIPKAASTRIEDLAQAGDIGILSYSFVGPEKETFTLGDVVKNHEGHNEKDVFRAIKDYFNINCSRWYNRTLGACDPIELADIYREHYRIKFDNSLIRDFFMNGSGINIIERAVEILNTNKPEMDRNDLYEYINESIKAPYIEILCKPITFCHGDLNVHNLIWEDGKLWMIDFYMTGESHRMLDFVKLETSIKFDVPFSYPDQATIEDKVRCLISFEDIINRCAKQTSLRLDLESTPLNLQIKLKSIDAIRECAILQCGTNEKDEYNLSLFFVTAKHIEYLIHDHINGKDRYPELVLALISIYNLAKAVSHLIDR